MSKQPEALRLADALTTQPDCTCHASSYFECACDAIWPEQWLYHAADELRRLYAQRKPLTEEEIDSIWDSEKAFADIYAIARAIERAHGIT